jgi:hypothetical protein
MLKSTNQILVFFLELAMLTIYANYGYSMHTNIFIRSAFAILLTLTAIILWARFAAPKSTHRLTMPYLAVFRTTMFLTAAFLVHKLGYENIAILMTAMIIITQIISYFSEQ